MSFGAEYFDFSTPYPYGSNQHLAGDLPTSASPCGWSEPAQLTNFERELCTDFSCCGLRLQDLHALLDHFEESHVMTGPPRDSNEGYPVNAASEDSFVYAAPETLPTPVGILPASRSSELVGALGESPIWSTAAPFPIYPPSTPELVLSNLDQSSSPSSSSSYYSEPSSPQSLSSLSPASSHFFHSDLFAPYETTSSPQQQALPPSSFAASGNDDANTKTPSSNSGFHPYRSPAAAPKRNDRNRRRSGHSSRKREKQFRCPQPNCTKAYLNPNGLKYHLEKGTCTMVEPTQLPKHFLEESVSILRSSSPQLQEGDGALQA